MKRNKKDHQAIAHAVEQALAYLDSGQPELLAQGLVPRLEQFLTSMRTRGRSDTQAIALLRRNPGLMHLH